MVLPVDPEPPAIQPFRCICGENLTSDVLYVVKSGSGDTPVLHRHAHHHFRPVLGAPLFRRPTGRCAIKDVWSNADRRLLHRFQHEDHLDSSRVALGDRYPAARGMRVALGPRIAGRSKKYVWILMNGLLESMGRVGACADNAVMDSFYALLQRNVLDRRRWRTRNELRLAIVTWIERTYH